MVNLLKRRIKHASTLVDSTTYVKVINNFHGQNINDLTRISLWFFNDISLLKADERELLLLNVFHL